MNVALVLLNQREDTKTIDGLPEQVQAVLKTLPEDAKICEMNLEEAGDADLILLCATTNDPRAKKIAAESGRRVCVDVDHFERIDGTLYAARSIYSTHAEELIPAQNLIATISLPEPSKEEVDLTKANPEDKTYPV